MSAEKASALLESRFASMAALYADTPETVANYAAAQVRYRIAAEQGMVSGGAPLITGNPYFVPWLWATPDGATIRKKQNGAFVITSAQLLGNWYSDTECYASGWPTFFCTDQKERLMSAPDAATIIFDDVEYKRAVPEFEPAPGAGVDPVETSLTSDRTFGPLPKEE
ncbi:MAG TPA: hypothetical protein VMF90_23390 [Rhizobiaceae bacterium]|nr:hypothetical protein [Rhizobiaceae bacterium]